MASSDDFREQLKAGNITEAFALALSKAVELKITTWVADDGEADDIKLGHRLHTRINMIDGYIENEIGDQFLGNGPYRELRQFHHEQVTKGNQIIQNNLKSLQKLFEVLVAMHRQAGTTLVVEPDALQVESRLLPATEEATDVELANLASSVAAAPLIQDRFQIAQTGSTVEESLHIDMVSSEDVVHEPPSPSEDPVSFLTPPTDNIQESDSETDEDDDWDDSVLDLLESLPVGSRSLPEDIDSEFDEDRRNLIAETPESELSESELRANQDWGILRREDFESSPASPEPHSEPLNAQSDQDWGDFIQEEPQPHPTASDSPATQDRETLNREDFESPTASVESDIKASNSEVQGDWGWDDLVTEEPQLHPTAIDSPANQDFEVLPTSSESYLEGSNTQIDEDWGDLLDEEPEHGSDKAVPNIESLDLDEEEEWDEWIVEESDSSRHQPIAELESLDLEEDTDWDDFEDDPELFAIAPSLEGSASDLEIDENWDDLATDLDVESDIGAGFNSYAAGEDPKAIESAHHSTETPDLRENVQTDSSKQHDVDRGEEDLLAQIAAEDFLGDEPHASNTVLTPEESEGRVLSKDSDVPAVSEDDLNPKQKPGDTRVPPPPPPPHRFPNQNQ